MADKRISELTALAGASVVDDDALVIVDTSATQTKKIVFSELKAALDTSTGFVRITGDTMTGDLTVAESLGIGTTSVIGKIHANDSSGATLTLTRTSGATSGNLGKLRFGNTNVDSALASIVAIQDGATDNSAITFGTQSSGAAEVERMRLTSDGNFLVGTTSSITGKVQVVAGGDAITTQTTNSVGTTNSTAIGFKNAAGSYSGAIYVHGSATTYATSSDYRLKENVADVSDGITRVKQLSPKRFNFIADPDTTVDGFLAHEAQLVVPEAVTCEKDEVDADGNAVMQGIDQAKLVPLLTAALQEAIAKIETLETKVAALEGA